MDMDIVQQPFKLNSKKNEELRAVILAGGSGTRLWPLSRQQLPKQFLCLDGEEIMLEATIGRLSPYISSQEVLVVTNEQHANGEAYQTLSPYDTLLEPEGRNTAPAIALAAAWLQRHSESGDPVMIILPADHIIRNTTAFHFALERALDAAADDNIVTFGIKPNRPDTGFGYIKASKSSNNSTKIFHVEEFAEKPNADLAEKYIEDDAYYWNSGMFVWKTSAILKQIKTLLPDVYQVVKTITDEWDVGINTQQAINKYFNDMPDISIDYGVLEKITGKSSKLVVVPCDINWSDVGSWDAVYEVLDKDENKNACIGNVLALDCKNSLIQSTHRLIAAVGVDDICVVETPDAILLTKRNDSQRVRDVVNALKLRNAQEHILHLTVKRPWGSYTVLEEQPGFKMKRITVNPGASLSHQRHQHRSEHWVVVTGTATILKNDEEIIITKNQSTYIPVGTKHRLENRGKIPLQLIEVQVGDYLEEDDIERYDDVYGRT